MTRRIPVIPTILVLAAVAVMIGLGFWQLDRARQKEQLVEQYRGAADLPPITYPAAAGAEPLPLYRWATGNCVGPSGHRAVAGHNRAGESGYAHIVRCSTGPEGSAMAVEIGWSKDPSAKWQWAGGPVSGVIAPDREHAMRLVAATPAAGLQASALPSAESIPNNSRSYAVQWFLFAAIALIIYGLALRNRIRSGQ